MYDFLKDRKGIISEKEIDDFLQEVYKDIFQDVSRYKKLRDFIKNYNINGRFNQAYSYSELMYLDKLLFHLFPFLDSFKDGEKR